MRVLVTGHRGYIGAILVPMLIREGHEVVGLDSDLYRDCTYGEPLVEVETIEKDIRDADMADLAGVDVVIHLAALSNDPLGNLDPSLTFDINYRGTVHIAELAKQAGAKRFLFSSSCSNYGSAGEKMIDETAELRPVTAYGESKVRAERDLVALNDSSFCVVLLRNATAYGVSSRLRFDIVLNNLTAWAFSTGKIHIKSDGTPWRPLVHIEDITTAFLATMEAPVEVVAGEAFNIGRNEDNKRIREIAEIVEQTVPDCEIEYAADAGPDKRCYRVDCGKAVKVLDAYRPNWTIEKGVSQLHQSYQANGLTLEEFEGPRYNRISHIQHLLKSGRLGRDLRWTSTDGM